MQTERLKALNTGIGLFNQGKYYEAHEAWEHWWLKDRSPERGCFQGLILIAAAFHHRAAGRSTVGKKSLHRALDKLKSCPAGVSELNPLLLSYYADFLTHWEERTHWVPHIQVLDQA